MVWIKTFHIPRYCLASVSSHIWWLFCTCWYRGSMAGSTDVRPRYSGSTNSWKNCGAGSRIQGGGREVS